MNTVAKYNTIHSDLFNVINRFHDCFWADPVFQFNRNWRPTEITETETSFTLEVELPRFKREDVKVEVFDGKISIIAKNSKGSFEREFNYTGLDVDKSDVKLQDGVLRIEIPKLASNKSKKYLEVK